MNVWCGQSESGIRRARLRCGRRRTAICKRRTTGTTSAPVSSIPARRWSAISGILCPDEELAEEIIRTYFTPVHEAAAEANRMKNRYRDRVRKLKLSRKVAEGNLVSEAHAVQLLGEAEDNIRMLERSRGRVRTRDGKSLEEWRGVVKKLWEENPKLDAGKIRAAVDEFRKIYDELFEQMNGARIRNGYEPVNYRSGYFPHFQPGNGDGILAQFGRALGITTEGFRAPHHDQRPHAQLPARYPLAWERGKTPGL